MKAKVRTKKAAAPVMEGDLHERLDLLIACGHPIFVIGKSVCWPAEADMFCTDEEMDELEGYILSNTKMED